MKSGEFLLAREGVSTTSPTVSTDLGATKLAPRQRSFLSKLFRRPAKAAAAPSIEVAEVRGARPSAGTPRASRSDSISSVISIGSAGSIDSIGSYTSSSSFGSLGSLRSGASFASSASSSSAPTRSSSPTPASIARTDCRDRLQRAPSVDSARAGSTPGASFLSEALEMQLVALRDLDGPRSRFKRLTSRENALFRDIVKAALALPRDVEQAREKDPVELVDLQRLLERYQRKVDPERARDRYAAVKAVDQALDAYIAQVYPTPGADSAAVDADATYESCISPSRPASPTASSEAPRSPSGSVPARARPASEDTWVLSAAAQQEVANTLELLNANTDIVHRLFDDRSSDVAQTLQFAVSQSHFNHMKRCSYASLKEQASIGTGLARADMDHLFETFGIDAVMQGALPSPDLNDYYAYSVQREVLCRNIELTFARDEETFDACSDGSAGSAAALEQDEDWDRPGLDDQPIEHSDPIASVPSQPLQSLQPQRPATPTIAADTSLDDAEPASLPVSFRDRLSPLLASPPASDANADQREAHEALRSVEQAIRTAWSGRRAAAPALHQPMTQIREAMQAHWKLREWATPEAAKVVREMQSALRDHLRTACDEEALADPVFGLTNADQTLQDLCADLPEHLRDRLAPRLQYLHQYAAKMAQSLTPEAADDAALLADFARALQKIIVEQTQLAESDGEHQQALAQKLRELNAEAHRVEHHADQITQHLVEGLQRHLGFEPELTGEAR